MKHVTKRGAERLLKLADVLENFRTERKNLVVPIETFNLEEWQCGTAACAVGTAMLHPWFRKRGLIHRATSWLDGEMHNCPIIRRSENLTSYTAARSFFDVEYGTFASLFLSDNYASNKRTRPATVAKRIRHYVATGEIK